MSNKIIDLIVNSVTNNKQHVPAERYYAPLTLHHFDNFTIEICHNNRPFHNVLKMSDCIGQIGLKEFENALKMRTERLKKEFQSIKKELGV